MRYSSQGSMRVQVARSVSRGALIAAGLAFAGQVAVAQTATTVPTPDATQVDGTDPTAATDDGEIVVTGFRASLENAVIEKKNRDQVVESISAEDIGKLPDASIAESIARLPGLTSQRVSGRSSTTSVACFST